jgi:hypothetical protein
MTTTEQERFLADLVETGSRSCLPGLTRDVASRAVYSQSDRCGVTVAVVPTSELDEAELDELLTFRLAQYVSIGFVDRDRVFRDRLEREPRSAVGARDFHYVATETSSGRVLCYASLRPLAGAPDGATLRTVERPLFEVEETFGRGVFNRLRLLPELPITRIFELKRFVKNQSVRGLNELGIRAPVELLVAYTRSLTGVLREQVDAFLGDLEETVAKRNFDFFYAPIVVLPGAVSYTDGDSFLYPHFRDSRAVPFAMLVDDQASVLDTRIRAIEAALEQPGEDGLRALLALRNEPMSEDRLSSLVPADGVGLLGERSAHAVAGAAPLAMEERAALLEAGRQLQRYDPFATLSAQEATVLRSMMERIDVQAGNVLLRRGDPGDRLYLIESGTVAVEVHEGGGAIRVASLGPGDYFGEIALVTGSVRTADVVALSDASLLSLDRATYARYLSAHVDVERRLAVTAAERLLRRP